MKIWKVILAALVIFSAGVVTGGLTVRLRQGLPQTPAKLSPVNPPVQWPIQQRAELLRRMDRHLNLTPTQRERIEQILHESQQRVKQLWDPISPKFREEFRYTNERILQELTPSQRKTYYQLVKPRSPYKGSDSRPAEDRRRRQDKRTSGTNRPPAEVAPGPTVSPKEEGAGEKSEK